jgi:hypothetical protein
MFRSWKALLGFIVVTGALGLAVLLFFLTTVHA